ncbi:transposase [Streptomyces sp. NBC_01336]|uniref:transposase n=1 Tax=Streptomyces sp. NBC_01336 TaxID=2903829 RepID=UPI002E144EE2|nr:transposase [Streptomyces sp. NBC_01336]
MPAASAAVLARSAASAAALAFEVAPRRPLDVRPGRDAAPLAAWLRGHPQVEIICRNRAGAYAEGARAGAPQAMQIADGWHLWRNLAQAVEKTVGAHHGCIRAAFAIPPVPKEPVLGDLVTKEPPTVETAPFVPPDGTLDSLGRPRRLVTRTIERYEAVQQRLTEGKTLAAIRRELRLDHSTVRRFARARSLDELLVKATNRETILDEYKTYTSGGPPDATTFPSSTVNCANKASPETSSASAATSARSKSPTAPGPSSHRWSLPSPGRHRSPAASSAGS